MREQVDERFKKSFGTDRKQHKGLKWDTACLLLEEEDNSEDDLLAQLDELNVQLMSLVYH